MNYVITGSTGQISKPITQQLIAAGNKVTVVTSKAGNAAEIQALGATAAVGSVTDRDFLTRIFASADAVYLMIPPKFDVQDWFTYQKQVADNYLAAVKANNIKHVVILSSVGAHMRKGCGPVDGAAYLEYEARNLTGTHTLALRPTYFYYNLFGQVNTIKQAGIVASTQPADFKMGLTHTSDIADVAAARLLKLDFTGNSVQYIASDDTHTWAEITKALGAAIGKPELPYVQISDEQLQGALTGAGLPPTVVEGYVTMNHALTKGDMLADYWANRPKTFGKVKLNDFVKEFAGAYGAAANG